MTLEVRPLGVIDDASWCVRRIVVIGPGVVGMPMAALLAHARIRLGSDEPARVTVVQRRSPSSGWKIDAINAGRSPIGGLEPALDDIVRTCVAQGLLNATHDYAVCREADAILVCVQTDHRGDAPDYGLLLGALRAVARELALRPKGSGAPLVVIESTLAPSSLESVICEIFSEVGLEDGRDVYLGHSPNRVMPGRLVERVSTSDKLIAGLRAETPLRIDRLYRHVVTRGTLHPTNALTAEVAKTLENAYRDVRIALAAEVARYCDAQDIDFYALREWVNGELLQKDVASFQPASVPRGGLLVPTLGVGGHCLPKDGILLWWRARELGLASEHSLILEARRINDESPAYAAGLLRRQLHDLAGRRVALLGTAYRFNSDDARNSPTFAMARVLRDAGAQVRMHDPYVRQDDANVGCAGLSDLFTRDLGAALHDTDAAVLCVAHRDYVDYPGEITRLGPQLQVLLDAANAYDRRVLDGSAVRYAGIGRGEQTPPNELCQAVYDAFRVVERGVSNEVAVLLQVLNAHYAPHDFARVRFDNLQRLVGSCATGCALADPGTTAPAVDHGDFSSRLVAWAMRAASELRSSPARMPPADVRRTRVTG